LKNTEKDPWHEQELNISVEPATRAAFPFTALVGQPQLQRALQLAAIDPGIGGVLISGPRGTAKSTAARALAALLPGAPFVTLPLAASLEQLVGTLNMEDVLRDGQVRLAPGLLARAHNGVLYVDEVNLLPDALVDALLDVGRQRREHGGARRHFAAACRALCAGGHHEPGGGRTAPAAAGPLRPVGGAGQPGGCRTTHRHPACPPGL
jgi:MoxR-like ATPase